jgi:Fe-S cluster biogenesis protein NfuA
MKDRDMEEQKTMTVREKVEMALQMCRPYLNADGGDVELVQITDDGVVEVRLQGVCSGCPMSRMTLRAGIERAVLQCAPEIKRVEEVK